MKVQGEEVQLLVIGNGQIYTKKGIKLKENVIISEDGKGYLRMAKMSTSLDLFLHAHLEMGNGEVSLEDVYKNYFEFCNAYGLEILPFDKFVKALGRYVKVKEVLIEEDDGKKLKLVAEGVSLTNKVIQIDGNGSDVYFFVKQGLFRKRTVPTYVVFEGVPKTVSFNEVKGVGLDGFGTLRVIDDASMGQLLTETMLMGATIGTQKFFKNLQYMVVACVVIGVIAIIIGIYNMVYVGKVAQTVQNIQTQINTLVNIRGGIIK